MYKEVDSDYIINLIDEIFTFAKLHKSDEMFDVLIEAIDVETICWREFVLMIYVESVKYVVIVNHKHFFIILFLF